jgi:hypothetical protein
MSSRTPKKRSAGSSPKTDIGPGSSTREPIPLAIPPSFKRTLRSKPMDMQGAVLRCIELLGSNTRHPSLNTHPVQGTKGVYEAYVDAGNRVTFHYERAEGERSIVLRRHCNHDIIRQNP